MAIAIRNEGAKVSSNINVTPMVDVMLVLLIIFMVITPMLQKGVSVDMAKVNNPTQMPDADKEDAIVVAITRDGDVFFGKDKVSARQVDQQGQGPAREQDRQDRLRACRPPCPVQSVVEVVDDVRTAGVDDLGCLPTEEEYNAPASPPAPATSGAVTE